MVTRNIRLEGYDKLKPKLDAEFLLQPEFDDALETIGKRLERQGKGLGAQRNTLSRTTKPLGAQLVSTLNYPRTTGRSWGDKNRAVAQSMAPNVVRKTIKRIQERWAQ